MEPLVEVHTSANSDRALSAGAKIIGVNNRNLKTLDVRVETSFELIEKIPHDCIAVSESGIASHRRNRKAARRRLRRLPHRHQHHARPDPAAPSPRCWILTVHSMLDRTPSSRPTVKFWF